jgi:hypothetical protein
MEWKLNFRDDGILEIKSSGLFCNDDLKKMIEQIISNPKWEKGMNALADFREVDIKKIKFKDIQKTKDIHSQFSDIVGSGKIAAILSSDLGYGLSRSYEAISNRHVKSKMMTFRKYENGMEWIKRGEIVEI